MNINTDTLKYYVNRARISLSDLQESIKDIEFFLSGEKSPSFAQISTIAKKLNIPTGLLLLNKTINLDNKRLEFRTLHSTQRNDMSEELRDTILDMESKQSFLREQIDYSLDFVGAYSIQDNIQTVATDICKLLNISPGFQKEIQKDKILSVLKEKINSIGVFVFFNGKVGDNTHRPLSLDEFRGFVLADKKAPIIFINQKDESINGKVFTLLHELVHLFIGTNEIFTIVDTGTFTFDKTEAFINKVTAEILLPEEIFSHAVAKLENIESDDNIKMLADMFRVSVLTIIRRLYSLDFISQKTFLLKNESFSTQFKNKKKPSSGGGNYNNNLAFRIDKNFFKYVQQALQQQKISYTDAFRLIGVSYKGYKSLTETTQ
ncbi:ImmA/IrrE family metallo-endopeptidase [Pelistega suis]|uniref:ImmA/IrrE family metallo-endopeptidase n=1 Tax=Pelistega suis TaxID=1631957 RepID=UPI00211C2139|nr:ImmA/IrrE family metallo-endopeptidase [Pelistega suis]MCQ9328019.1 ImmA/IrrE family metallo-endopeptidase [Pelistega suis]